MIKIFTILFLLFTSISLYSQTLYFPPTTGDSWETLTPESLGWCGEEIDVLLDYLEQKNTKAFILLKDGKIVIEKYFGTFTKDSIWYWASAGKSLTAFLVGIAQQEKFLSISDTTSKFLGSGWTNCTKQQEEKITIWHQLSMTTGLDDGVTDPYCTLKGCLNYLAEPGTRWAYHNAPYTLLDKVIENATGQNLNVFQQQKLRQQTGITGLFIPVDYNNVYFSTARSMARFGLLMLNKGTWNDIKILTDMDYYDQMINSSQELNKSYGYLWWLNGKSSFMLPGLQYVFNGSFSPHAPDDMYAALGKNGQYLNIVPDKNLVFVRMGNAPGTGEISVTLNDSIWEKLNNVMCNTTSVKYSGKSFFEPKIYPNPSNNFIIIEMGNQIFDYTVYTISGMPLKNKIACRDKEKLNISDFKKGVYFIRLKTLNNQIFYRKILFAN